MSEQSAAYRRFRQSVASTLFDASARQVGGDHYLDHGCQPWDIIEDWDLDFWEGNALKYLLRRKPGVSRAEDLRKAIHYLERAAERAEDAQCP